MNVDTAEAEGELRDALARLLRERCDIEQVRRIAAASGGWDRQLWSELSAMGVVGLAVPSEHGGEGAGLTLLAVAQEELGRRVAPVPLLSSATAQAALLAVVDGIAPGAAAAAALLPEIASGRTPATVAVGRTVDGWTPLATVRAEEAVGGWRLTGTAPVVADAAAARALLVAATTDTGPALFAVDVPATGGTGGGAVAGGGVVAGGGGGADGAAGAAVRVEPLDVLDATRPLARVTLDAPATLLAGPAEFAAVLAATRRVALTLLAAEAVGVSAECTDLAVGYAGIRHQFGRPIGTYQAISHRCADMFVGTEAARALVAAAAQALDEAGATADTDELDVAVALAAAEALDAAVSAAQGSLQVHGGIGFTWEHPVHHYLRRAKSSEALIAAPDRLREQAASRLVAAVRR
ncbi:acyl-CoA dehydrogenase family protein [Frankia sp. QA3]|uniref:acyl-CoA dehydrogenase family protein n=1 Tax=Frankia sp. QA3 TaxID=710111 RepID=UPI000269B73E|nr:acyl-CoA dehydrogenase family protein [Frankia sp. QA3]EIV90691.1 acyl-CoA dehydrogenase [Frankia sp. QA3]